MVVPSVYPDARESEPPAIGVADAVGAAQVVVEAAAPEIDFPPIVALSLQEEAAAVALGGGAEIHVGFGMEPTSPAGHGVSASRGDERNRRKKKKPSPAHVSAHETTYVGQMFGPHRTVAAATTASIKEEASPFLWIEGGAAGRRHNEHRSSSSTLASLDFSLRPWHYLTFARDVVEDEFRVFFTAHRVSATVYTLVMSVLTFGGILVYAGSSLTVIQLAANNIAGGLWLLCSIAFRVLDVQLQALNTALAQEGRGITQASAGRYDGDGNDQDNGQGPTTTMSSSRRHHHQGHYNGGASTTTATTTGVKSMLKAQWILNHDATPTRRSIRWNARKHELVSMLVHAVNFVLGASNILYACRDYLEYPPITTANATVAVQLDTALVCQTTLQGSPLMLLSMVTSVVLIPLRGALLMPLYMAGIATLWSLKAEPSIPFGATTSHQFTSWSIVMVTEMAIGIVASFFRERRARKHFLLHVGRHLQGSMMLYLRHQLERMAEVRLPKEILFACGGDDGSAAAALLSAGNSAVGGGSVSIPSASAATAAATNSSCSPSSSHHLDQSDTAAAHAQPASSAFRSVRSMVYHPGLAVVCIVRVSGLAAWASRSGPSDIVAVLRRVAQCCDDALLAAQREVKQHNHATHRQKKTPNGAADERRRPHLAVGVGGRFHIRKANTIGDDICVVGLPADEIAEAAVERLRRCMIRFAATCLSSLSEDGEGCVNEYVRSLPWHPEVGNKNLIVGVPNRLPQQPQPVQHGRRGFSAAKTAPFVPIAVVTEGGAGYRLLHAARNVVPVGPAVEEAFDVANTLEGPAVEGCPPPGKAQGARPTKGAHDNAPCSRGAVLSSTCTMLASVGHPYRSAVVLCSQRLVDAAESVVGGGIGLQSIERASIAPSARSPIVTIFGRTMTVASAASEATTESAAIESESAAAAASLTVGETPRDDNAMGLADCGHHHFEVPAVALMRCPVTAIRGRRTGGNPLVATTAIPTTRTNSTTASMTTAGSATTMLLVTVVAPHGSGCGLIGTGGSNAKTTSTAAVAKKNIDGVVPSGGYDVDRGMRSDTMEGMRSVVHRHAPRRHSRHQPVIVVARGDDVPEEIEVDEEERPWRLHPSTPIQRRAVIPGGEVALRMGATEESLMDALPSSPVAETLMSGGASQSADAAAMLRAEGRVATEAHGLVLVKFIDAKTEEEYDEDVRAHSSSLLDVFVAYSASAISLLTLLVVGVLDDANLSTRAHLWYQRGYTWTSAGIACCGMGVAGLVVLSTRNEGGGRATSRLPPNYNRGLQMALLLAALGCYIATIFLAPHGGFIHESQSLWSIAMINFAILRPTYRSIWFMWCIDWVVSSMFLFRSVARLTPMGHDALDGRPSKLSIYVAAISYVITFTIRVLSDRWRREVFATAKLLDFQQEELEADYHRLEDALDAMVPAGVAGQLVRRVRAQEVTDDWDASETSMSKAKRHHQGDGTKTAPYSDASKRLSAIERREPKRLLHPLWSASANLESDDGAFLLLEVTITPPPLHNDRMGDAHHPTTSDDASDDLWTPLLEGINEAIPAYLRGAVQVVQCSRTTAVLAVLQHVAENRSSDNELQRKGEGANAQVDVALLPKEEGLPLPGNGEGVNCPASSMHCTAPQSSTCANNVLADHDEEAGQPTALREEQRCEYLFAAARALFAFYNEGITSVRSELQGSLLHSPKTQRRPPFRIRMVLDFGPAMGALIGQGAAGVLFGYFGSNLTTSQAVLRHVEWGTVLASERFMGVLALANSDAAVVSRLLKNSTEEEGIEPMRQPPAVVRHCVRGTGGVPKQRYLSISWPI